LRLVRLDPSRARDLAALLERSGPEPAACACTAWHGLGAEREGEAWACRARFAEADAPDGFLLYDGEAPVAWAQCAPCHAFSLLRGRPGYEPDAWALTCVVVPPERRREGLAHAFVARLVEHLSDAGVRKLYAFGHRLGPTYSSPLPELPERVCQAAGMTLLRDHAECPTYALDLPRRTTAGR
jgi:GNAT superfamily N-acetyltransferase